MALMSPKCKVDEEIMEEKKNWFKELDPDVVFQQPLRPGCWIEGCNEPRTTGMYLSFPFTMFAQGLCDKHADILHTELLKEGYIEDKEDELVTGFFNMPLIDAFKQRAMNGTIRNSDLILPDPFPKDWHKYAVSVSLLHMWPAVQCWFRVSEKERCLEVPQITSVFKTLRK